LNVLPGETEAPVSNKNLGPNFFVFEDVKVTKAREPEQVGFISFLFKLFSAIICTEES